MIINKNKIRPIKPHGEQNDSNGGPHGNGIKRHDIHDVIRPVYPVYGPYKNEYEFCANKPDGTPCGYHSRCENGYCNH